MPARGLARFRKEAGHLLAPASRAERRLRAQAASRCARYERAQSARVRARFLWTFARSLVSPRCSPRLAVPSSRWRWWGGGITEALA